MLGCGLLGGGGTKVSVLTLKLCYMATFDYVDKTFLILSAASGSASITSFATDIGAPIGIVIAGTGFAFPIISKITKKLLKTMRKKKKKQNKTVFFSKK